jgi:hypothetical protein
MASEPRRVASRRTFLRSLSVLAAGIRLSGATPHHVRLAVSGISSQSAFDVDRRAGIELGLQEGQRLATLIGGRLDVADEKDSAALDAVICNRCHMATGPFVPASLVRLAVEDAPDAGGPNCFQLAASFEQRLDTLAAFARARGIRHLRTTGSLSSKDAAVVRVLSARDVSLVTGEPVVRADGPEGVLRLGPTDEPGVPGPYPWLALPQLPLAWADEWHPALEKFGAGELNERFLRAVGRPMTPAAWLGWMAVKSIVEAAFRPGAGVLRTQLRTLRIDGHKGIPLSFDVHRRLEQPLYVSGRSRSTAEPPILLDGASR